MGSPSRSRCVPPTRSRRARWRPQPTTLSCRRSRFQICINSMNLWSDDCVFNRNAVRIFLIYFCIFAQIKYVFRTKQFSQCARCTSKIEHGTELDKRVRNIARSIFLGSSNMFSYKCLIVSSPLHIFIVGFSYGAFARRLREPRCEHDVRLAPLASWLPTSCDRRNPPIVLSEGVFCWSKILL